MANNPFPPQFSFMPVLVLSNFQRFFSSRWHSATTFIRNKIWTLPCEENIWSFNTIKGCKFSVKMEIPSHFYQEVPEGEVLTPVKSMEPSLSFIKTRAIPHHILHLQQWNVERKGETISLGYCHEVTPFLDNEGLLERWSEKLHKNAQSQKWGAGRGTAAWSISPLLQENVVDRT